MFRLQKRPLKIDLVAVRATRELRAPRHVAIVMQAQPAAQNVVLILDEEAARWLIQKIFMGQESQGTWSDIESGLLEYMSCKILAALHPFFRDSRFILIDVLRQEQDILKILNTQRPLIEVAFGTRTEIGLVHASLFLTPDFFSERKVELDFVSRAPWISKLGYSFSVDLGAAYLSSEQIGLLEGGDIILLDRSTVTFDGNIIDGKVALHSPRLRRGAINASVHCTQEGKATITIERLIQEGLRSMAEVKKTETPAGEQVSEVLSSLEIPVIVEFARLSFTLEELSALQEGRVIELEKPAAEVVDLSVDGKVIASGKLVDVEGKLGVQIMRILKK